MSVRIVWNDEKVRTARTAILRGLGYAGAGAAIGVSGNAIYLAVKRGLLPRSDAAKSRKISKWERDRKALNPYCRSDFTVNPPSTAYADREARNLALYRRDLTGAFFGDPPPGYSALDQKRAQS